MPVEIISPNPLNRDRAQLARTAMGIISHPFEIGAIGSGATTGSGSAVFSLIGLRAGDVVSKFATLVTAAGATLTLVKMGLYDTAGNQLAVTADVKADFAATGWKVEAAVTPYTVPADGAYYVAYLSTGTTPASIGRCANPMTGIGAAVGANPRPCALVGSQTDLTSTVTLADHDRMFYIAACS